MELTVSCAAMWGGKSRLNGLSSSGRGWNNRSLFLALMVMSGAPARAQSGSEVPVVVVSSLEQLRAATDASAPHIVLQSHLALTSLPPQDAGEWLFPLQGVKSIRGNCSDVPLEGRVQPSRTSDAQCVITVQQNFMRSSDNIWLEDLYLKLQAKENDDDDEQDEDAPPPTLFEVAGADAWLINSVLAGDRFGRGLNVVDNSRVYARGTQFSYFSTRAHSAIRIEGGGSAALDECFFSINEATGRKDSGVSTGGPAIGLSADPSPSAVRLRSCTFEKNRARLDGDTAVDSSSCVVYSDDKETPTVWNSEDEETGKPGFLSAEAETATPWGDDFLNEESYTGFEASPPDTPSEQPSPSPNTGQALSPSRNDGQSPTITSSPTNVLPDPSDENRKWHQRNALPLVITAAMVTALLLVFAWAILFRKSCCGLDQEHQPDAAVKPSEDDTTGQASRNTVFAGWWPFKRDAIEKPPLGTESMPTTPVQHLHSFLSNRTPALVAPPSPSEASTVATGVSNTINDSSSLFEGSPSCPSVTLSGNPTLPPSFEPSVNDGTVVHRATVQVHSECYSQSDLIMVPHSSHPSSPNSPLSKPSTRHIQVPMTAAAHATRSPLAFHTRAAESMKGRAAQTTDSSNPKPRPETTEASSALSESSSSRKIGSDIIAHVVNRSADAVSASALVALYSAPPQPRSDSNQRSPGSSKSSAATAGSDERYMHNWTLMSTHGTKAARSWMMVPGPRADGDAEAQHSSSEGAQTSSLCSSHQSLTSATKHNARKLEGSAVASKPSHASDSRSQMRPESQANSTLFSDSATESLLGVSAGGPGHQRANKWRSKFAQGQGTSSPPQTVTHEEAALWLAGLGHSECSLSNSDINAAPGKERLGAATTESTAASGPKFMIPSPFESSNDRVERPGRKKRGQNAQPLPSAALMSFGLETAGELELQAAFSGSETSELQGACLVQASVTTGSQEAQISSSTAVERRALNNMAAVQSTSREVAGVAQARQYTECNLKNEKTGKFNPQGQDVAGSVMMPRLYSGGENSSIEADSYTSTMGPPGGSQTMSSLGNSLPRYGHRESPGNTGGNNFVVHNVAPYTTSEEPSTRAQSCESPLSNLGPLSPFSGQGSPNKALRTPVDTPVGISGGSHHSCSFSRPGKPQSCAETLVAEYPGPSLELSPATQELMLWISQAEATGSWLTGRYDLLGQQRPGTNSVTVYAVECGEVPQGADGLHDRVLKFFTDREAFQRVQMLHSEPAAAYCTTVVKNIFPGDPQNAQLAVYHSPAPPCIVTMRLETFEQKTSCKDLSTTQMVSYLAGVARAVATLHEAGYVYHSVKPSDVGWSEHTASWELLDFSRCIRAGTESRVPMEMDVLRRAPEIQAACDQKCEACVVHKATDMWALGLMGHELLTGKPAFPQGLPRVICRMLSGKAPLPWEDHAGSRDNSKELAYGQASDATRTAVLACLARDPANRPSASMLADNLEKLL